MSLARTIAIAGFLIATAAAAAEIPEAQRRSGFSFMTPGEQSGFTLFGLHGGCLESRRALEPLGLTSRRSGPSDPRNRMFITS